MAEVAKEGEDGLAMPKVGPRAAGTKAELPARAVVKATRTADEWNFILLMLVLRL